MSGPFNPSVDEVPGCDGVEIIYIRFETIENFCSFSRGNWRDLDARGADLPDGGIVTGYSLEGGGGVDVGHIW